ncbi:hypothetical protein EDC01DRAFT_633644 [Geopyxis carbonaria]|nr:hypothetical protein EDC01DRAFT_633644 [Geopyxis carbonaria]
MRPLLLLRRRLPPLQRALTTTPAAYAQPASPARLRAARAASRPPPAAPADLLPTALLLQAHKSSLLPVGPSSIHALINTYPINTPPSPALCATLCSTHSLTPRHLGLVAHMLLRTSSAVPARLGYARHLLAVAAHGGDGDSAVTLYGLLRRAQGRFAADEGRRVFALVRLAAEGGHGGAMLVVGDAAGGAEAEEWWRRAGEAGEAVGWYKFGLAREARGDVAGAEEAWRRGGKEGSAECWEALGRVVGEEERVGVLERAAAAGATGAARELAAVWEARGEGGVEGAWGWAREWWGVVAEGGSVEGAEGAARVGRRMGDKSAEGWEERAAEMRAKAGVVGETRGAEKRP